MIGLGGVLALLGAPVVAMGRPAYIGLGVLALLTAFFYAFGGLDVCWKAAIPTRGEALTIKRSRGMRVKHVYYCAEHDAWHVTSMSRNVYKQSRRG